MTTEPLGVSDGQRPQDDRVHDTEYGGVDADTEGERQHDRRGEHGRLPQQARRKPDVMPQGVTPTVDNVYRAVDLRDRHIRDV